MSTESIRIIVDQASMGTDDDDCMTRYCELLEQAVSAEFPHAQVSVEPGEWNDGRVDLDGFDSEDPVRWSIQAIKERVFNDGAWAA